MVVWNVNWPVSRMQLTWLLVLGRKREEGWESLRRSRRRCWDWGTRREGCSNTRPAVPADTSTQSARSELKQHSRHLQYGPKKYYYEWPKSLTGSLIKLSENSISKSSHQITLDVLFNLNYLIQIFNINKPI